MYRRSSHWPWQFVPAARFRLALHQILQSQNKFFAFASVCGFFTCLSSCWILCCASAGVRQNKLRAAFRLVLRSAETCYAHLVTIIYGHSSRRLLADEHFCFLFFFSSAKPICIAYSYWRFGSTRRRQLKGPMKPEMQRQNGAYIVENVAILTKRPLCLIECNASCYQIPRIHSQNNKTKNFKISASLNELNA